MDEAKECLTQRRRDAEKSDSAFFATLRLCVRSLFGKWE